MKCDLCGKEIDNVEWSGNIKVCEECKIPEKKSRNYSFLKECACQCFSAIIVISIFIIAL